MAIYGYTKNYKLIKPKYDTDTWHDYEYDNLDTIDAVLSAIYASGNWKGFWATNTAYVVGDVVIDRDTDTMYKVMFDHTTSEATFAAEWTAHPNYYELWSPNNLAESWATKADGKVSNEDYSAKAYAISSGLISEGSAKEWAIGSGAIGNTNEYSAKKYATDAHNDYISMTTNANVSAVGSNINNVNAVGQSISSVNTVASDISSVNTVAGVSTDVTTVAGIASSVPTVADNNANITTVANNISDVNTAATNIAAIQYAPTAASNAAQSAANAANSATISANSAIWAEGTDAQVQALGGVHSSKGWAEQSTSVNISLTNTPYTTNRILEISQDIKLELNNGTLTLKAGSKVYVPNGFESDGTTPKFDEVVITNDVIQTNGFSTQHFMMYQLSLNNFSHFVQGYNLFSGSTDPTGVPTASCNYNTTLNKMRFTGDGGSSWTDVDYSLPFAISTSNSSQYTSIDQVFNGFGYIGSTVFALPGVQVQIPNGRNADGTLKSIEYTTDRMVTYTFQSDWTTPYVYTLLRMDTEFPSIFVSTTVGLSENNYIVINGEENRTIKGITLFRCSYTNGRINADFEPYTVDSVVNSNEFYQLKNKAVTTDTTQTISGQKAFTNELLKKSTVIDITTQPTTYMANNVRFVDKNDNVMGYLENAQQSDGSIKTGIHARNKDGYQPHIGVYAPMSGTTGAYATAPNTPDNAPANAIVTTSWFNSKMQVVSALPAAPDANVFYFIPE